MVKAIEVNGTGSESDDQEQVTNPPVPQVLSKMETGMFPTSWAYRGVQQMLPIAVRIIQKINPPPTPGYHQTLVLYLLEAPNQNWKTLRRRIKVTGKG